MVVGISPLRYSNISKSEHCSQATPSSKHTDNQKRHAVIKCYQQSSKVTFYEKLPYENGYFSSGLNLKDLIISTCNDEIVGFRNILDVGKYIK